MSYFCTQWYAGDLFKKRQPRIRKLDDPILRNSQTWDIHVLKTGSIPGREGEMRKWDSQPSLQKAPQNTAFQPPALTDWFGCSHTPQSPQGLKPE